jgi:predicted anti-sigma-YlaC factor YlaD
MIKTEKMNCDKCQQKLIPYLEDSLKGTELQQMEQHLEECASCRGFAEYLKVTLSIIENSRVTQPDPFFYTRVKAKMDKQEESLSVKPVFVRILQPAALSLLLMAATFAGIKIGSLDWSQKTNSYVTENLEPLINELDSEPLETFLMDE